MSFKSKLPEVGTTIFSVMSAMAADYNAVNLSQGFPDFKIDERLKEYVDEALINNQVQYAPMPGRLDLRTTLAKKIMIQHSVVVDPISEITITAGATQAIYTAISAVVNEGDEVVLFDPAYDCYAPAVILNKGVPVHLNLVHPNYSIDWNQVENSFTDKTRLIIVNNPHNPTGSVWSKDDIEALKGLVVKYPNLLIISDEVYEHIQYEDEHLSILKDEILRNRSVVTYSFGKTLHVTGWKIGYCVAPEFLTAEIRKIHQYMVFCANNTMQYAINKFLSNGEPWLEIMPLFKKKRDLFLSRIADSRFKALPCDGTYFCLLDYSAISNLSDVEFTKELTQKYGVATIPTSVFYKDQTDHKVIRVCFAKEDETLINAAERLCKV